MADSVVRAPRSLTEAQRLCERWSALDAEIAAIEEARDVAIAAANAEVDKDLAPLLAQRAAIAGKLEPWWGENAALLTQGKRKSAELGGVELGTRDAKSSLIIAGDEADLRDVLSGLRWAKPFLRVSVSLDKVALAKGLVGKHSGALAQLGVSRSAPPPVFYIKRTGQAGTQAKVQR